MAPFCSVFRPWVRTEQTNKCINSIISLCRVHHMPLPFHANAVRLSLVITSSRAAQPNGLQLDLVRSGDRCEQLGRTGEVIVRPTKVRQTEWMCAERRLERRTKAENMFRIVRAASILRSRLTRPLSQCAAAGNAIRARQRSAIGRTGGTRARR